jgi:Fe-S cluster assembly scaffold protein SufB
MVKLPTTRHDGFTAINTAMAQDGVFIYVPDGVKPPKPFRSSK